MKVNMTPNPLDVVTIHASQGDTEARQWEFELHNNGELIDTSDVKEQLVFKAYKGGTEQLLPENGSTPTTSPIIADIKYPQGLLTDQEFTYRQSPTEEDGLAKITDIKGNTLVWNQIFKPQYRSNSGIQVGSIQDGNDYSVRIWGTSTANAWLRMDATGTLPVGHKFLLDKGSTSDLFDINNDSNGLMVDFSAKTKIGTVTTADKYIYIHVHWGTTIDVTVKPMLIDLTQMGLDSLTDAEILQWFADYFPLSYYSYNQGSLLSFNGNGLKTTGKNEANIPFEQGAVSQSVNFSYQASKVSSATRIRCESLVVAEKNKIYKCNWNTSIYDCVVQAYGENRLSTGASDNPFNTWFTVPFTFTGTGYVAIAFKRKDGANITPSEIDSIRPNLYLADTESITNLPISTYFPNGMKSAGSVYDELTPTKAITRIGAVDLGSLNWEYRTTGSVYAPYFYAAFTGIKPNGNPNVRKANILCSKYSTAHRSQESFIDKTICADGSPTVLTQIQIKDSSYTDATALKNSLQGQYLYYEMVTETESSFSTASLVTENAEIPLSNEDGTLIGKCTEQLSENPGFFDAKIKLSDADGECYSNKLQLHVERSPQ